MDPAQDLTADQFASADEGTKRLTTWYAQGHSDGLGDRLLMFDNTSAPSWEILRFKPILASQPNFEAALRQRVERLGSFRHAAFPAVRPITELGHEDGLAVVSTYASGVCLAEGLKKPRSAAFAVRLLRQLVPALAALHQHEPGLAHGAVTLDRLVLTSEGRLMVREHMVGSALASLELSAAKLWTDFGILAHAQPANPGEPAAPVLDPQNDVTQIALVVVSLMVGRRLGPDEYPERLGALLDQIEDRSIWHEPETFRSLRTWLERALQLREPGFASARDAQVALADLREEPERTEAHPPRLQVAPKRPSQEPAHSSPAPPAPAAMLRPTDPADDMGRDTPAATSNPVVRRLDTRVFRWAAIVVGVVALAEAGYIGRLLLTSSKDRPANAAPAAAPSALRVDPVVTDQPRLTPPPDAVAPPAPQTTNATATAPTQANPKIDVRTATAVVDSQPAASKPTAPPVPPAPTVRSGGFRVSSSIELHVLDGERLLGSSVDGPIIAPAGQHEYEFVN